MEQVSSSVQSYKDIIYEAISREVSNAEYLKLIGISENKNGIITIKARNVIVTKIRIHEESTYIEIREKNKKYFENCTFVDSNDGWCRIIMSQIDEVLKQRESLLSIALAELEDESFGCCSRYEICSDEKHCVQPDPILALSCAYRKNLEAGRIFYGKNRNI